MPDDLEETRRRFGVILCSAACQKVDFWLGGLHVNGAGFYMVARALAQGGRDGKGVTVRVQKMKGLAAAGYDQVNNAFLVPNKDWAKSDTFERIAVVHEAVHVIRDAEGLTLTYNGRPYRPRAPTDEAAAYVAGCLFSVHEQREGGGTASDNPAWLAARKAPIHRVAYKVALRQADRPRGSAVERAELSEMYATYTAYIRKKGEVPPDYYEFDGLPK